MSIDSGDEKAIASQLISQAWQEASAQGISSEVFASTALTAAIVSLVKLNGTESAARIADRLADAWETDEGTTGINSFLGKTLPPWRTGK